MTVKYIRLESSANIEKRIEISNRIIRGEIKLSHYAVDNDIFYHYYEILIPLTNKKNNMINKIKCFFGFHNWKNIRPITPIPGKGEQISFSNLHKCEHCDKEQWLGMGTII